MQPDSSSGWTDKICHQVLLSLPDGITITDNSGKILMVSQRAIEIYGCRDASEIRGTMATDWVAPESREKAVKNISGIFLGITSPDNEYVLLRKDGSRFLGAINVSVLTGEDGSVSGMIASTRDITEKRDILVRLQQAEQETNRVNRALRTLSEVNQILVRIQDEKELLEKVCSVIVEIGGYRMCWVGFASDDSEKRVVPVAQKGFDRDYLSTVRILWDDSEEGNGPTGRAIRQGTPVVVRQIRRDPVFGPWRETAILQGYNSSVALPLVVGNRIAGALNIYSDTENAFDEKELELLKELAGDLGFGLDMIRMRIDGERTGTELKKKEQLLAEMGHIAKMGGWEFDVDTGEGTWTDEVAIIHEMDPGELTSMDIGISFYVGESKEKIETAIRLAIREGIPYDLELEMTTGKGNTKWVRTIGEPVVENGRVVKLRGSFQDISARKRLEKERWDSEVRYRSLFDHSMDAVLLTSPDGSIREVNPATCGMFGMSAEEIRRKGRNGLVDLSDTRLYEALREREATGKVFAEINMIRADGTRFPVELTSTIFSDSAGRSFTSMIIRDISVQKENESRLKASEQKFSSTFRYAPLMMAISELRSGLIIDVNEEYLRVTGYSRAEIIGRTALELGLIKADTRATVYESLLREGLIQGMESTIFSKSGTAIPSIYCGVVIDLGGTPYVLSINQDITAMKMAEMALKKTEEQLNFALEISQTGGWDLDLVDHTAFRTLEHDRIFGYETLLPEWTYEMFLDHVLTEDRDHVDRSFREAVNTGTPWSFECRIRRTDGAVRWIWAAGEHQKDDKGGSNRMTGIVQDITERKQAEQMVRETMAHLIETEEALRKSTAQELHDEVGQNLTALSLNLNFLKNSPPLKGDAKVEKRLMDSLHIVEDTVERIRNIMTELRPSVLDNFGLNAALQWSAEQFTQRTSVPVKYVGQDIEPRLPVNVEYALFRMVQESLHNVIKHSKAGAVEILLERSETEVSVRIRDDGIGFDVAAVSGKGSRRGLGLMGMEERMKALGGRMTIESFPGKGTSLTFIYKSQPYDQGIAGR